MTASNTIYKIKDWMVNLIKKTDGYLTMINKLDMQCRRFFNWRGVYTTAASNIERPAFTVGISKHAT